MYRRSGPVEVGEVFRGRTRSGRVVDAEGGAFDAHRDRLPAHYNLYLVDEPAGGRDLKFYLLLTEMPDLLAGEGFTAEGVFWSRYYWLRRYALVRAGTAGYDAGLEQQVLRVLEYPHPACTPDWADLEAVDAAAGRDAATELAWAADPAGPWPV